MWHPYSLVVCGDFNCPGVGGNQLDTSLVDVPQRYSHLQHVRGAMHARRRQYAGPFADADRRRCVADSGRRPPDMLQRPLHGSPLNYIVLDWTGLIRLPHVQIPQYLIDCLPVSDVASRQHLRSASRRLLVVPRHRLSTYGRRAFAVAGSTAWNSFPDNLRDPDFTMDNFKRLLKTFLFSAYQCN